MSVIYVVFAAFISVALIAFGWMPCPVCCVVSGVSTLCCVGVGIPETLYFTLTHVSGTCTCLDGVVVQLDFVADANAPWDPGYWQGSLGSVCTNKTIVIRFYCRSSPPPNLFLINDVTSGAGATCFVFNGLTGVTLDSCSPFSASGTVTLDSSSPFSCCFTLGTSDYTFTVTE